MVQEDEIYLHQVNPSEGASVSSSHLFLTTHSGWSKRCKMLTVGAAIFGMIVYIIVLFTPMLATQNKYSISTTSSSIINTDTTDNKTTTLLTTNNVTSTINFTTNNDTTTTATTATLFTTNTTSAIANSLSTTANTSSILSLATTTSTVTTTTNNQSTTTTTSSTSTSSTTLSTTSKTTSTATTSSTATTTSVTSSTSTSSTTLSTTSKTTSTATTSSTVSTTSITPSTSTSSTTLSTTSTIMSTTTTSSTATTTSVTSSTSTSSTTLSTTSKTTSIATTSTTVSTTSSTVSTTSSAVITTSVTPSTSTSSTTLSTTSTSTSSTTLSTTSKTTSTSTTSVTSSTSTSSTTLSTTSKTTSTSTTSVTSSTSTSSTTLSTTSKSTTTSTMSSITTSVSTTSTSSTSTKTSTTSTSSSTTSSSTSVSIITTTLTTGTTSIGLSLLLDVIPSSVTGLWNTTAGGISTLATAGYTGPGIYAVGQGPSSLFDGNLNTKYTSTGSSSTSAFTTYAGLNTGFYVTIAECQPVLIGFRFGNTGGTTEREPLVITVEGTNCNNLVTCTNWSLLYTGSAGLDTPTNSSTYGQYESISNSNIYKSYRFLVTIKRSSSNYVGYSEVQLYGSSSQTSASSSGSSNSTSLLIVQSESIGSLWNTFSNGISTLATESASPYPVGTYPTGQSASNLFDGNFNTIYSSRGNSTAYDTIAGLNTGFYVTVAQCQPTLTQFRFGTTTSSSNRDPTSITIEGTSCNDLLSCTNWTMIYTGDTGLSSVVNRSSYGTYQSIPSPQSYTGYRFLVTAKRGAEPFVAYSEVALYGY